MLRERYRRIGREALMADYSSISSPPPTNTNSKPTSFPRLFTGFAFKNFSETTEAVMSPTSILDSKPFSSLKTPFWSDPNAAPKSPEPESRRHNWDKLDSKGIGLAILDALKDDEAVDSNFPKPESSRMVLFGSRLKIQIPPLLPSLPSPSESPKSPADFGIKTRNSQLGSFSSGLSPSPAKNSAFGSANLGTDTPNSPGVFTGCFSTTEMELSEDYTCVIFHGPNPRTTHIFDNCVIESDAVDDSALRKETNDRYFNHGLGYSLPSENFLSFCYACKKNLGQGKDIYMYRGEKAFCSSECRYQEMMLEEEIDELEPDDVYGARCS